MYEHVENQNDSKIASIKEVQSLFDFSISKSKAARLIQTCKDALGKPILTMFNFKQYYNI